MVRYVGIRTAAALIAKTLTAVILALSFPWFAAAQAPAVPAAFLIVAGQGIGSVRLGMTLEQVRAALGREVRTESDPVTGATVVAWTTAGAGRLGVWFRDGKAIDIAISRDPRFATAQGLRDGDAADKVRQIMGAPLSVGSVSSNTLGRLQVFIYPGILVYVPTGANDTALDGKVYSIIVAAGDVQVDGGPPAQSASSTQAPPAQPASPAQPVPPAAAAPAQPAPPTPSTTAGAQPVLPASSQTAPGGPPLIVPGRSIGAVRLGMTLTQVTGLFGDATNTQQSPGGSVTYWWLDPSKRGGFGAQVAPGDRIDRLFIMNNAQYATDAGLHVGSLEGNIRVALGPPSAASVDATSQRETLRYDALGVWFEIQLDRQSPGYGTVVAIDIVASGTRPADRSPSLPNPDRPETGGAGQ